MIRKSAVNLKSYADMLKPRIIASELLKKRLEEKVKGKKLLILNSADLQILGGQYQGFHPSVLVNSEGNTYLFNCGAGTQRYCYTNKVKVASIENVFITNRTWNRMSGIYGLALTVQDVGCPNLTIHSTEGIEDLFDATNSFMTFNTGMQRSTRTYREGEYSDSSIRVQPIILDEGSCARDDTFDTTVGDLQSNKRPKVNSKLVAYHCQLPDLPGPLDPKRCKELKVPIGRQLAVLKSGEDVQLEDGRVIKSIDVCGPKQLGLNFLVIECPSLSHIEYLRRNSILEDIMKRRSSNESQEVEMVIHFSPKDVVANQQYIDWYTGFADRCKHILLNSSQAKKVLFPDSYQLQYLLRKLDSEIFPDLCLPQELSEKVRDELVISSGVTADSALDLAAGQESSNADVQTREVALEDLGNTIEVQSQDRICIRPKRYLEFSENNCSIDALYNEARNDTIFEEQLSDLKKLQSSLPVTKEFEPEVVFLGTGSALPSKLRNTSCILLNFNHPSKSSVLLDCGEDSLGQLIRFYGEDKSNEVLSRLKFIYISHHHADHHVGLIDILSRRRSITKEPLVLLAPPGVDTLLDYYNQNFEDLSSSYKFFSTKTLREECSNKVIQTVRQILYRELVDFLCDIDIVGVKHCINSCAVSLIFKIGHPDMDTFKVGYSGDARPSTEFVRIGQDCDLLIHEATFDDQSQEDAIIKKHSTTTEAISIAKKMRAKFTILTHFSARFPKIPYFTDQFDETIGFAFDNLAIRCPSHYGRLPIMKPILSTVFKKSLTDIEMKYHKQLMKQQIIDDIIREKES